MNEKNKSTIHFGRPPEEILRDRKASQQLSPEQAAAQERMSQIKTDRPPLGGAPPVHIPPLDAQNITGQGRMTMEDQAAILTDPTNALSPSYDPTLAAMRASQNPLAPLPPSAAQHPGFRPGVGSMYAGNQPAVTSTQEEAYKPKLRPETLDSIKAMEAFRAQAEARQAQELNTEAGGDATKKATKTPFDDFDYKELRAFQNEEEWNLLNNPKRRKEIESQLKPMKVEDVILVGEVRQDVPVAPGVWVTYRSVGGDEDLAIKQMMFGEKGGDRYVFDKYTIMQLALGVVSINNFPLPSHLGPEGDLDEKKFEAKFKKLSKFPIQFLANLGVNYAWFDERVRLLFLGQSEELKNG